MSAFLAIFQTFLKIKIIKIGDSLGTFRNSDPKLLLDLCNLFRHITVHHKKKCKWKSKGKRMNLINIEEDIYYLKYKSLIINNIDF